MNTPNARSNGKRKNRANKHDSNKKHSPTNDSNPNNSKHAGGVTPNAVRKMLLADAYVEPLVVSLYCSAPISTDAPFVAGQICDKSFQSDVLICTTHWQQACQQRRITRSVNDWFLIKVSGYVTSAVNAAGGASYPSFQPFLCLVSFEIEATSNVPKKSWEQLSKNKRTLNANQEKLPGGSSDSFLSQYLEALSAEDLMGESLVEFGTSSAPEFEAHQAVLQDFLMHHKAMKNLEDSNLLIHHSSNEDGDASANAGETNATQPCNPRLHYHMYNDALQEFASAQLDRQKASLTSNAGRANATDATKVVEQYKATLELVLQNCQDPQWISRMDLKALHLQLCGNGLHERAGQIRTITVKAGRTTFCPANEVEGRLQTGLLPMLELLFVRLLSLPTNETQDRAKARKLGRACLTFCSAVFFGIVDLHPFADGNGRLARLLSQGALKALGLPFCINWFATPAQRRDYVLAILMTRRNLSLIYRGQATISETDAIRKCLKVSGVYFPLVSLLMDRTAKAIPELIQLEKDKQASAAEHDEARAARRARERAAASSCLICFDDHPNIATLCCGKAVHLSCIAEWLSSNASCPNCRGNFPALPARPAPRRTRHHSEDEDEDEEDDTTFEDSDTSTDDTTMSVEDVDEVEVRIENAGGASDDTIASVAVDDSAEDDDDTTVVVVNGRHSAGQEGEDTTELFDDTTTDDDDAAATETTNTTDDTNVASSDGGNNNINSRGQDYYSCLHCNNRAALECTNTCCGRCCLLHGQWGCSRHSNAD